MHEVQSNDVFAAAVPEEIDVTDALASGALIVYLDQVAKEWVWRQWANRGKPLDVTFAQSEWLITDNPELVDKFQPAHDCEECKAGNETCRVFLRENPGRWVAMANLHYMEVWPD